MLLFSAISSGLKKPSMLTSTHGQSSKLGDCGLDRTRFTKTASDPVPVPASVLGRVTEILQSGRLFRYGEDTTEQSDVSLFEAEFATFSNRRYVNAVNSCGCSLFLALQALGVENGDYVLCNAFTLAPVPGAIVHAGATPLFVDAKRDLTVDLEHLQRLCQQDRAKVFMLSHMRGHFADIDKIIAICKRHKVKVLEDCAHTLGADWAGKNVGGFGDIACYSSQTFKHLNSGEGGLIATDDADMAAKITIMSGSYMLYQQNGARPDDDVFEKYRDQMPNYSMRMTNLSAALLRPQLDLLETHKTEWNKRYRWIESGLRQLGDVEIIERGTKENFVGSSIQFHVPGMNDQQLELFVDDAAAHGVYLKWFGRDRTTGFTSRFDQWGYAESNAGLTATRETLQTLMDMRIALSLNEDDCRIITLIIGEALAVTMDKN